MRAHNDRVESLFDARKKNMRGTQIMYLMEYLPPSGYPHIRRSIGWSAIMNGEFRLEQSRSRPAGSPASCEDHCGKA